MLSDYKYRQNLGYSNNRRPKTEDKDPPAGGDAIPRFAHRSCPKGSEGEKRNRRKMRKVVGTVNFITNICLVFVTYFYEYCLVYITYILHICIVNITR